MIMKVLIMSVTAGNGHNSTAQAMIEEFEKMGIECHLLDTLEYINKHLGTGVQDGYLFTTKHFKSTYGKIYSILDKKEEPYSKYAPGSILTKQISKYFAHYIQEYNPDAIITTHSYPAVIISVLLHRNYIKCPTFGIVTDFTIHPFWESADLDYYILPSDLLIPAAEKKGIPKSKIIASGIPVKSKFAHKIDKVSARTMLGLDNKTTIMVMMGSMGFGKIIDIIEELDKYPADFQVVCICGNNKHIKQEIDEHPWNKKVVNLGFIDNVDEYMDASDAIITKPGGLTTSEALAKKIPLILSDPLPGQEDRNIEFLVNTGVAINITPTFPLENALYQIFDSNWRCKHIMDAVENLAKPNAASDICKFINNLKVSDL